MISLGDITEDVVDQVKRDECNQYGAMDVLSASVPAGILSLSQGSDSDREEVVKIATSTLAGTGGQCLLPQPERGSILPVMAMALSVLALQPGGVTFGGVHWCADHSTCLSDDLLPPMTRPIRNLYSTVSYLYGRPVVDVPLPPE